MQSTVVFLLGCLLHVRAFSSVQLSRASSTSLCQSRDVERTKSSNNIKLVLPIFPLRKAVKFPSETLILNLYEERYLHLAEYVLAAKPSVERKGVNKSALEKARFFGALYSSDKPQMVRDGLGPVVPMIQKGDQGTLFIIVDHEDDLVPTRATVIDGSLRRRIKLKSLGVGRFVVERVLHNGYGGGAGAGPLPFILVEASLRSDVALVAASPDEARVFELEQRVVRLLSERAAELVSAGCNFDTMDGISVDEKLSPGLLLPFLPSNLRKMLGDEELELLSQIQGIEADRVQRHLELWECLVCATDEGSLENVRHELFSFAATVFLGPSKSPQQSLQLLKTGSTIERLEYAINSTGKGAWFSKIFET